MPRLDESNGQAEEARAKRRFLFWMVAACLAAALLVTAVVWRMQAQARRWGNFMVGDPSVGAALFYGAKSCARCHSVSGAGGTLASDLGRPRGPRSNMEQLVSAMWNHAPGMWARMRAEKVAYPALSHEDMAHLIAFLYTAGYVDEAGDQTRGETMFTQKSCVRCHSIGGEGGTIGPDLSTVGDVSSPIRLTQTMWNHAPAMERDARKMHLAWPKFEGHEMNDLAAYLRAVSGRNMVSQAVLPADPERGLRVFQNKSCILCHTVRGKGGKQGPELGPGRQISLTIVRFAGEMWNHSPEMWRALQKQSVERPAFEGQEIADLVAFLCSLRYFEPAGSALAGELVFAERGCAYCHGKQAEGTRMAPRVRSRPEVITAVTLATSLWAHGPQMAERAQQLNRPWPTLNEADVGDLIAFLNSPFNRRRP